VLAERLRAQILGEGLQPGDPLWSEAELINRFSLARATVRETLRLLENDGLIEIRRGRNGGVVVREPDLAQSARSIALRLAMRGTTLRALFEYRLLIEPAAAEAAARNATLEERALLTRLASEPSEPSLRPDVRFHNAIGEYSHNDLIHVSIAALAHELAWHAPGEGLTEHEFADTADAHRLLARAIQNGDGGRAKSVMHRHIEQFRLLLDRAGRLDQPIMPRNRWLPRLER